MLSKYSRKILNQRGQGIDDPATADISSAAKSKQNAERYYREAAEDVKNLDSYSTPQERMKVKLRQRDAMKQLGKYK